MVDGSPVARVFLACCFSAGALMCTAFAAQMTAALMRSADRLPIMVAGLAPDEVAGFSNLAEPWHHSSFTLANALNRTVWRRTPLAALSRRFFVRLNGRFSVPACFQECAARSGGQHQPQGCRGTRREPLLTAASTEPGLRGPGRSWTHRRHWELRCAMRPVSLFPRHDSPSYPRQLVGERHRYGAP